MQRSNENFRFRGAVNARRREELFCLLIFNRGLRDISGHFLFSSFALILLLHFLLSTYIRVRMKKNTRKIYHDRTPCSLSPFPTVSLPPTHHTRTHTYTHPPYPPPLSLIDIRIHARCFCAKRKRTVKRMNTLIYRRKKQRSGVCVTSAPKPKRGYVFVATRAFKKVDKTTRNDRREMHTADVGKRLDL